MTRIMITGATGLLGRALKALLEKTPTNAVIATGFSRANHSLDCSADTSSTNTHTQDSDSVIYKLDLTDELSLNEFIEYLQPDVIVHCAAERRPDVAARDPQAALALNLDATRMIALAAKKQGAKLIYISTDYVFDGTKSDAIAVDGSTGSDTKSSRLQDDNISASSIASNNALSMYSETDAPHPVNFYGESKWRGEQAVLDISNDFVVLRLPILYGQVEQVSESAVMVLLNQLIDTRPQKVDNWAIRRPTSTLDIALAIEQIIALQQKSSGLTGIYHFSAVQSMTKYQMLRTLAEVLGLSAAHLEPLDEPLDTAKRPKDCSLSCQRLSKLGIVSKVEFVAGVRQALKESAAALAKIGLKL